MRRGLAFAAALAGLLLLLAWTVPRGIDWNARRGELAALSGERLGRTVTLDGPVRLVLLPQPLLEVQGVTLGGEGEDLAIGARALLLRLDLGALLTGRILPREVALVGAEIRLPWPPAPTAPFRPPPWLAALDARIEDSRLLVGHLALDGLSGRFVTAGVAEALRAEGQFAWRGQAVRFLATIGRPGLDGIAPIDITLATSAGSATARGLLAPEGGFDGTVEFAGSDLSAFLPAPQGGFRGRGRLSLDAELVAADELALEIAGSPARGAVALRLGAAARLDVALLASRLDLDAWVAALRGPGLRALPVGLDLSAEAASFRGVALRRLRGGVFLEGERLTLSDVTALLPGEAAIEITGATAGERLELAGRIAAPDLRATLGAFATLPAGLDPAALREAEARFRLSLSDDEIAAPEFTGTLDGARVSGAAVLRPGPRAALGLGLQFDRLDLARYLPAGFGWREAAEAAGALDANLRLSALEARFGETVWEDALVEATLEGGAVRLRRLAAQIAGAGLIASGAYLPGATPRLAEISLEAAAPHARLLAPLLPAGLPLGAEPFRLRATGGGPLGALALEMQGEWGELRFEGQPLLDLAGGRASGPLTLRHPGAPRLAAALGMPWLGGWLGEGSASMIGAFVAARSGVSAERFELVFGGLRASGQGRLALDEALPRLTGRLAAERLPLPRLADWPLGGLDAARLSRFAADLALRAERAEMPGLPPIEQAAARLTVQDGVLALTEGEARLAGGRLAGQLRFGGAPVPELRLEGRAEGLVVSGAVFGLPLDVSAGRLDGAARLHAAGSGRAAWLGSLSGRLEATLRDGVLVGFDLGAAAEAARTPGLEAAEAGLRGALGGGATAFERLALDMAWQDGRARLASGELSVEGGLAATLRGEVDAARGALDLALSARLGEGPPVGLRLVGPAAQPSRAPELAPWLRWRAEGG